MTEEQVKAIVQDAHGALTRLSSLSLGSRMTVGDLAFAVLALAEENERLKAEGPLRPRTLIRRPGGRWDAFESFVEAEKFAESRKAEGDSVEGWNVSEWAVHRCQSEPGHAKGHH